MLRSLVLSAALVLALSACFGAGLLTFTNVDFPSAQITAPIAIGANVASGINNAGQIVGFYDDATGRHGFLRTRGLYRTLDPPTTSKGVSTTLSAVNDSGQVVGNYSACNSCPSPNRGFLFSGGVFTDIIHPAAGAGGSTSPQGINNAGQIVGYYSLSGANHGFLLNAGVFTSIEFPGATSTSVFGINNAGQIVGAYENGVPGQVRPFLLKAGVFTSIPLFPGSSITRAWSINDSGQIAGDYALPSPSDGYFHGFLLSGTTFTSVDFPGAANNEALGINNAGQIVGGYAGGAHAFLAQTPAASSMAQLAAGGGWMTTITLINTDPSAAEIVLNLFDDNGNPLQLPLTFPQGSLTPLTTASFTATVNPSAELVIQTTGLANAPTSVGWSQLLTTGSVSGFAVFAQAAGNSVQEAVVPIENRTPRAFVLSFDNVNNYATGVAIANVSSKPANVGIVIRDDSGTILLTNSIVLPAQGHTSFGLAINYPITTQRRGSLEFDTPPDGQISVLGLRFNSAGAFTSIPSIAK